MGIIIMMDSHFDGNDRGRIGNAPSEGRLHGGKYKKYAGSMNRTPTLEETSKMPLLNW